MNGALAAGGDPFLLSENLDRDRGFGGASYGFQRLKVYLIINLTS